MVQEDSGFLFICNDPSHASVLISSIRSDERFSDIILTSDFRSNVVELCLHSLDGQKDSITHASIIRLGAAVATGKRRILSSNFIVFDSPVKFTALNEKLSIEFVEKVVRLSSGGVKRLESEVWKALLEAIIGLQPALAASFNELKNLRKNLNSSIKDSGAQILAQEKDSIGLALDIFGLDREEIIFTWSPVSAEDGNKVAPYLKGLHNANILEDSMNSRDARFFSDWQEIGSRMICSTEFTKNGQILTVSNFNRYTVEQNIGVDLIYQQSGQF